MQKCLFSFADGIPTRLNVALMIFLSCFISYMMRVNLSINIIAMVQQKSDDGGNSTEIVEDVRTFFNFLLLY